MSSREKSRRYGSSSHNKLAKWNPNWEIFGQLSPEKSRSRLFYRGFERYAFLTRLSQMEAPRWPHVISHIHLKAIGAVALAQKYAEQIQLRGTWLDPVVPCAPTAVSVPVNRWCPSSHWQSPRVFLILT